MKKNLLNLYEGFFDDLDQLNKDKINDEFRGTNANIYDQHDYILSPDKNPKFFKALCKFCKYEGISYKEIGFTQEDLNQIYYLNENNYCFRNVTSLDELQYFNNLERMEPYCFNNCIKLKSVIFPKNLKKIEYGTFGYCTSLQKIIFSENIQSIEKFSFACCENVKKIVIPKRFKNNIHDIFYNVNLKKVKKITYI